MKISVKSPKTGKSVEFDLAVPKSLKEMVQKYGEQVVFYLAYQKLKTKAMNHARELLNEGATSEHVVEVMSKFKPTSRLRTALIVSPALEQLDDISDDDMAAVFGDFDITSPTDALD